MVHEHVHYLLDEVRLLGTEEPSGDLVHGLLELWQAVVVIHSMVSARHRRKDTRLIVFIHSAKHWLISLLLLFIKNMRFCSASYSLCGSDLKLGGGWLGEGVGRRVCGCVGGRGSVCQ